MLLLRWAVLASLCLVAVSCARQTEPDSPRLVVLYATCTVNRDYLGPYDPMVDYTPHLDEFAGEAVTFTRHQTLVGSSGPSFATLFTGTLTPRHQAYYHPKPLSEDNYLLAEAFADNGYETFFWSGHMMASASLGYGQGVSDRNTVRMEKGGSPVQRKQLNSGDPMFMRILDRLRKDRDYKAFIQINFTMTHGPYDTRTSEEDRSRFALSHPGLTAGLSGEDMERFIGLYRENYHDLIWNFPETVERLGLTSEDVSKLGRVLDLCYRTAVQALDHHFGAFIETLRSSGLYDESLVAMTADHGEILYRENALFHWGHGKQLAPEVLLVPLCIRSPVSGVRPGTYDGISRSIDIFPTLAGLAGLSLPDEIELDGVDLSSALRSGEPGPDLPAISHTSLFSREQLKATPGLTLRDRYHPGHDPLDIWTLIREGDLVFKLQHEGNNEWKVRVFDWVRDPGESQDLYDPGNPHHREMMEKLIDYKKALIEGYPLAAKDAISDDEKRERLRSLGYIN